MKLVSLNTWGGQQKDELKRFFTMHAPTTDIFCLQEVAHTPPHDHDKINHELNDNGFTLLQELLPDFEGYFAATHGGFNWRPVDFDLSFGNALFVRKNIQVLEDGHVFVYRNKGEIHMPDLLKKDWFTLPRLVQYVQLTTPDNTPLTVFNFHGLWHTSGKGDMPARIEQSKKIKELVEKFNGKKVLCGDFNLDINTESLAMLEEHMCNLIKEFDIKTTRSKHYDKIDSMPFADYTFVSSEIDVKKFIVPYSEASDHLPMILEFN